MSKGLQQEIYGFVTGLPEWQKILAAHLLGLSTPDLSQEVAIDASLKHLLFENKLKATEPERITINNPVETAGAVPCDSPGCKLVAISEVVNLNALSPSQTFSVAREGITVVYGENGVGKSGYGRLFNSVFCSRGDSFLIGNVFGPTKNQPSSAVFELIGDDGNVHKLRYPQDKNHPFFRQFAAFDSKSVNVHIDSQNELHVQPVELDFFEQLIKLIQIVSAKLENLAKEKKKENLFQKAFPGESVVKLAVQQIDSKTNLEKVEALAKWTDTDESRLQELEVLKAGLSVQELEKTKTRLNSVKTKLSGIKSKCNRLQTELSDDRVDFISKAIVRYGELKAEVSTTGIEQFQDVRFRGIGSDLWQQFIKSGRDLSNQDQSPHNHAGDPCVYCRQNLTEEAADLIQRYGAFLESTAREGLKKAGDWGAKSLREIEAIEIPVLDNDDKLVEWLTHAAPDVLRTLSRNFEHASTVKQSALNAVSEWKIEALQKLAIHTVEFEKLDSVIDLEIQNLNEQKVKEQLKTVSDELIVLQHRKVLAQLLPEIRTFVSDAKLVGELEKLIRQIARTTTITNKATELNEKYISNRYVQQFKQECIDLNIPCPDLSPVGSKGKTKRKYSIVGELPSRILSEGEQRAVALADFFTEAQISSMSGLIFDDPVNSQDYKRKGKIAQRLAIEAKNRQVVVLTHDLLFLNDLAASASDAGVPLACHWMSKNNPSDTGIIYANTVPDIEKAFIDAKLAKDRLEEAKGAPSPLDKYRATKDGLGALRASYEAFIVRVVFDGIVERFSRRVRQSEIHKVHAPKEALFFITEKLGELSGYITGHLQFDPSSSEITPELLEREISVYEKFSLEFKKEKKEALKLFVAKVEDGTAQARALN